MTDDRQNKPNYIVEYYEGALPQYFICFADNGKHAVEQCINAYPEASMGDFSLLDWKTPIQLDIEKVYDRMFGL